MSKILTGKKGTITERDRRILEDLFLVDRATVGQLWRQHFEGISSRAAQNRLLMLRAKGRVENETTCVATHDGIRTLNFYRLTAEQRAQFGRSMMSRGLDFERLFASFSGGRKNPEFAGLDDLEVDRALHQEKISALYFELKGALQRHLRRVGEGWIWRNERRALRPYEDAHGHKYYRPDAEILLYKPSPVFADLESLARASQAPPEPLHLFFEVQTKASGLSSASVADKVAHHALAHTIPGFPPKDRTFFVFIGETLAHVEAAATAASSYGVPAICGDASQVRERLYEIFAQVALRRRPELPSPVRTLRAGPPFGLPPGADTSPQPYPDDRLPDPFTNGGAPAPASA